MRCITSADRLHPAENRGLRELYAAGQQLAERWPRLARWLDGQEAAPVLDRGVGEARELLRELSALTPDYGLFGSPGARGVGRTLGAARHGVMDRFLERNQALRLALVDVQHPRNLLAYLEQVARSRGDERLAPFCRRWDERLATVEDDLRAAVLALGRDPDQAIAALDPSPAGSAARRLGNSVGALGEALDRRLAERRGRGG